MANEEIDIKKEVVITASDYLAFAGVDLYAELGTISTSDVGDQTVDFFITGVEEWMLLYISKPPYNFNKFRADRQKEQFKKAVLSQIQYVIRNGNIIMDAGFRDGSPAASRELIRKAGIAPDAYDYLRKGGLINL